MNAIGDVLGHRDISSTAVYLRLAVDDLREVGLTVPEGGDPVILEPLGWKCRIPRVRPSQIKESLGKADFCSGVADSLRGYLSVRRALGRRYAVEEQMLLEWDDFLFRNYGERPDIELEMFHRWSGTMDHLTSTVRRNRMRVVRNFLIFHARNHPETGVPDITTFPKPQPPKPPRLVAETEMARILAAASQLPPSHQNLLRGPTIRLALVLLYCCGLRRGELLRLKLEHFDPGENVLRIESTKFNKSRLVPLTESVAQELDRYLQLRLSMAPESYLIQSDNPVARERVYSAEGLTHNWLYLCLSASVLDESGRPPRLHDLRHSFAVTALNRWYERGENVQAKLPHLATYLGHVCPSSTHYYLHLTPGLRDAASRRFDQYAGEIFGNGGAQ
jgi:integrase